MSPDQSRPRKASMSTPVELAVTPRLKRMQLQAVSNALAMQDYRKAQQDARNKTDKLRALRLARDAEAAGLVTKPVKAKRKTRT